jgi:hypothetical protein
MQGEVDWARHEFELVTGHSQEDAVQEQLRERAARHAVHVTQWKQILSDEWKAALIITAPVILALIVVVVISAFTMN